MTCCANAPFSPSVTHSALNPLISSIPVSRCSLSLPEASRRQTVPAGDQHPVDHRRHTDAKALLHALLAHEAQLIDVSLTGAGSQVIVTGPDLVHQLLTQRSLTERD